MILDHIARVVANEMHAFQQEYARMLSSEVVLIDTVTRYIIQQKSKKIRPLLLLLSARLCGQPNAQTYRAASLVEVLHTATLIHDDVVDESDTRRSLPSVKALWNNKVSVLLGDFLFSRALSGMLAIRDFAALDMLSHATELLSSGEILQIEKSFTNSMDETIYYEMIWAKTAVLFAVACKLGACTVGAATAQADALYEYGRNIGIAFQLKDDLFDCVGREQLIGKPTGRDIKSNLITLPVIYVLNTLPPEKRAALEQALAAAETEEQIRSVSALIAAGGGVAYTEEHMQQFSQRARAALTPFPESEVKQALIEFTRFNEIREQ